MPALQEFDTLSKPILVGCALNQEVRLLRDQLADAGCDWIATGLGAERTRRALNRRFAAHRPRLFIFTGAAGALSDRLEVGDVVFPESWRLEDGPEFSGDVETMKRFRRLGIKVGGTGLTVREPTLTREARRRLRRTWQAVVCDMESAAALESAAGFGVPAVAFKAVSDAIGEDLSIEEFKRRLPEALHPLAACLEGVIRELRENPELAAHRATKTRND